MNNKSKNRVEIICEIRVRGGVRSLGIPNRTLWTLLDVKEDGLWCLHSGRRTTPLKDLYHHT